MKVTWTEELVKELERLAKEGYTYNEAAAELAYVFRLPINRSMVSGKAQQQGIRFGVVQHKKG